MTLRSFKLLTALCAAAGAACFALLSAMPELIGVILTVPGGLIVELLWAMARLGEIWRAAAIALYVLISLIPAAALLAVSRRRKPYAEDWLLALLSAVLFLLMYRALDYSAYINSLALRAGSLAVLVTWLALRLLRCFNASDNARLVKLSRWAITLIGLLSGFAAGWQLASTVAQLLTSLWIALFADGVSALAQSGIVIYGCLLAYELSLSFGPGGELSDEAVDMAGRFYRYSARALTAVLLIGMAANLLKLAFISSQPSSSVNVSLPLTPLLFCLAALIISRSMAAHKRLRDDNDLFV